jgi:hypothetical protein
MFSVLVVVLRSDHIAGQGFSSGQREIPLIASLLHELLVFSCLAAFVTGIVLVAARLLI